ncbi:helix-loop-helix protein delilah [Drosophila sulfurigaster albostrigata]|uniref:helix-loop-helix protein delilah n=1 Tax=Drosophila sulfurigaster albostrigata TaxID=89887 RepID=UPI002D219566|nr:helix-loop-helix protein delilah [Drosophila sulfurigaster albostrigata]
MKSNTYELHNYAELDMELDSSDQSMPTGVKETRKRKANNATGCRRGEKYSLRQKRQKRIPGELAATTTLPTELPVTQLATELEATMVTATPVKAAAKAKNAAKTKAPPLSKYRRKTANARERTRMREINMAFEQLRHCVPQSITGEDAANTNEKLTKITTLRLAMKYIGMLSESLQDPSYESEFLVECLRESANREAHISLDSDVDGEGDAEPMYEMELEPLPPAKTKKPTKASNKKDANEATEQTGKTATTTIATTASSSPESCYASSSLGSPAFCAAACSPSSAYASLSSAASTSSNSSRSNVGNMDADSLLGMRHEQALSELNTLLLESDSDSLHCLDPSYQSLLATAESLLPARGDLPISMHSSLDKPDVELSLRLLDHSRDSFDFGSDQQPSTCISPLATLDSFHPFADLLHGEFPDIFLA